MSDFDGGGDDYSSSRSKRSRGSYNERERSGTRDSHRDRSLRGDRGRGNGNGYENERRPQRDYGRQRDYKDDRDRTHRPRVRSRSRERNENHSVSPPRSRSRSKSKRTSGFDMPPPAISAPTGAEIPGQLLGVPQVNQGMIQNMMPYGAAQLSLSMMPAQAMTQQATRHARRVYVGGLPPMANEQTIATFFSSVMNAIGGNSSASGDSVVNVYINHEKKFAFVEMRTVEEASNAMALDGIIFEGVAVRVRRPTDYNPALAATLGPSQPSPHLNLGAVGLTLGGGGITGTEGPERIFVGGIPYYFTEVQIRELLESFGTLRGFDLVKDKDTGNSKGYGFCVYQDPSVTDVACGALNGLKMGDKTLTVRRATMSTGQSKSEQDNILAQAQQHIAMQKMALGVNLLDHGALSGLAHAESPTKVLCLAEAIIAEELENDEAYEEILEDMRDECGKFGNVVNVVIPRPNQNGELVSGVGKVFLEYSDTSGSTNARHVLNGRKFAGNTVNARFYPEDKYHSGDYSA